MSIVHSHGYQLYIRSPEWEAKRQQALARAGRRCAGCGSDGSEDRLEVHHLTYERLGYEQLTDLMVLCSLCHAHEHGNAPNVGPVAGPTVAVLTERVRDAEVGQRLRSFLALRAQCYEIERLLAEFRESLAAADVPPRDIKKALRKAEYGVEGLVRIIEKSGRREIGDSEEAEAA